MATEIPAPLVTETVARLCQEANFSLPEDVQEALRKAREREESPLGKETLAALLENAALADREQVPICQDCGTAVVFLEVGQDAHITGGDLSEAVAQGVAQGYREGYLRKSMVAQPFSARRNTGDNTPPVIHTELVPGDRLKITVLPKGAGSENMSRLAMLRPTAGTKGIIEFAVQAVAEAGSNPCPPIILGVGIGGTAEKAMLLAKQALLRPVGQPSPDAETAALEAELLDRVNSLGIGPEGFGGRITALAVHIETFPAHIASLPVALSFQCHAARSRSALLPEVGASSRPPGRRR